MTLRRFKLVLSSLALIVALSGFVSGPLSNSLAQDEQVGPQPIRTGSGALAVIPTANNNRPQPADDDEQSQPVRPKPKKFEFKKHGAIVYRRGEDFRLTLDVYKPQGDGPFPAVLAVHGGAWRSGSKITMLRHAWKLAAAGYVVVAINYRHAPKHKFPAQIHDCKHAVRWMRFHAKKYKIDPDRIAAFGYSAGGHLVSLLGTSDANSGLEGPVGDIRLKKISTRVQAVIAGGAPCEFSWVRPDRTILAYWLGNSQLKDPQVYVRATATTYVTPDDPPFYFFHGDSDAVVPITSSQILHQALVDVGVSSQHHIAEGKGHIATFSDTTWMNRAIEFLEKNLPPPAKPNSQSTRIPATTDSTTSTKQSK